MELLGPNTPTAINLIFDLLGNPQLSHNRNNNLIGYGAYEIYIKPCIILKLR